MRPTGCGAERERERGARQKIQGSIFCSERLEITVSKKKESKGVRNWKRKRESKRAMRDLAKTLLEYAAPLTNKSGGSDEMRAAMEAAVLCWNASFLEEEHRREMVGKSLEGSGAPEETLADFYKMVEAMVERKHQMFPEDGRMIRDWRLMEDNKRFKLALDWTEMVRTDQAETKKEEEAEA